MVWHTGIKFLVDMRADVRRAVKQSPATAGPLRALERNLRCCNCNRHSLARGCICGDDFSSGMSFSHASLVTSSLLTCRRVH